MFKIGKRGFLTFIARLFQLENYGAIPRFFYVHKKPLRSIFNEVFSLGKYPQKLYFNSPIGTYKMISQHLILFFVAKTIFTITITK